MHATKRAANAAKPLKKEVTPAPGAIRWKSSNDLPGAVREKTIGLLNQQLADAVDLARQAKQAHWNVKGPHFISLHELFDEVVSSVDALADELAERLVALGGIAFGTVQTVARDSRLTPYPVDILDGQLHVAALASVLGEFGKSARSAIDVSTAAGDADTADVFTEVSRGIDQLLWKVEAHGQV